MALSARCARTRSRRACVQPPVLSRSRGSGPSTGRSGRLRPPSRLCAAMLKAVLVDPPHGAAAGAGLPRAGRPPRPRSTAGTSSPPHPRGRAWLATGQPPSRRGRATGTKLPPNIRRRTGRTLAYLRRSEFTLTWASLGVRAWCRFCRGVVFALGIGLRRAYARSSCPLPSCGPSLCPFLTPPSGGHLVHGEHRWRRPPD